MVEHLSDDDLRKLRRGGHDYRKLYAAYAAAVAHTGAPTVILAKTVKGWTLGPGVEGRNVTHQAKKLTQDELKIFRDRLELPIPDEQLEGGAVLPPRSGLARDPVHARAPSRSWAARCHARRAPEATPERRRRGVSTSCSQGRDQPAARPWRSAA